MEKPKVLKEINIEDLSKVCQEYIDFVDNDEKYHEDNDYDHFIFEKAMKVMYGESVWDWINNRQN